MVTWATENPLFVDGFHRLEMNMFALPAQSNRRLTQSKVSFWKWQMFHGGSSTSEGGPMQQERGLP